MINLCLDVGTLLSPDEIYFSCYRAYDNDDLGFHDDNQIAYKEEDKDKAIAYGKKYVENGHEGTYAVLTNQGDCLNGDDGEFDDGMIEGFEYNLKDVIYSVAKINGKIVENFLMESLSGSSAEFSITATEIRKMLNLAADGWICEKIEENETLYIRFTKGKEEAEFELVKC